MAAIMNITEVPYGNAEINYATKTVTCQHGELECIVNEYEQCGIYLYPDQAIWLPYVVCVESYGSGEVHVLNALAASQLCSLPRLSHVPKAPP